MDVDWIGLLDEAISSDNATAVSNLVNDLLSTPDSSDRIATVHQYLIRVGTPSLRPEEVVLLLQAIATPSAVRDMPVVAIARLAEWLGKLPDSHPHHSLLSDIIQSLLVSRLKSVKAPSGARLIGYRPPSIAHAAFLLVRSLSSMEHQGSQRALKIFQTLVGKGFIPSEVLYSADRNIKDFDYIVKTALVRASLHWGWTSLAVNLLEELLSFGYSHQSHLINLVVDGLYILLDSPTRSDITAFTNVIRVLHLRIPTAIVPDGLLRQFYAVAHEYDMPHEAESVYCPLSFA
ncbi:hypothetical protein ONZ45_g18527 [Pleurotus djamor]|nr:hypothetical protein ONZ45_g18527 [Pleurotus djamor]